MTIKVALIGRPNVGKSTLFNRLVGKKVSLTHPTPGVTRDRKIIEAYVGDQPYFLIDTAGLELEASDKLETRMTKQSEKAIEEADLIFFLIDSRSGIVPLDEFFAKKLRKDKKKVIVVANKCESIDSQSSALEAYRLGFGDPLLISAEHNQGIVTLYEHILECLKNKTSEIQDNEKKPLNIVIAGRPNVGKSTLINNTIGEQRLLTGPEAGITRDSIAVEWTYKDQLIRLVDTAGMRKKSNITDQIEKLSVNDTLNSIRLAEVVVLVLDSTMILEKQDLLIAQHVIEEGRLLMIAINKWDLVKDSEKESLQKLKDRLQTSLTQIKGIPYLTLSGIKGDSLSKIIPDVHDIYEKWNVRLSTSVLNTYLEELLIRHPPPLVRGRRLKIRYITQIKSRPPTFALWVNFSKDVPNSYIRYLSNEFRKKFSLEGIPLRFVLRKSKNPYV